MAVLPLASIIFALRSASSTGAIPNDFPPRHDDRSTINPRRHCRPVKSAILRLLMVSTAAEAAAYCSQEVSQLKYHVGFCRFHSLFLRQSACCCLSNIRSPTLSRVDLPSPAETSLLKSSPGFAESSLFTNSTPSPFRPRKTTFRTAPSAAPSPCCVHVAVQRVALKNRKSLRRGDDSPEAAAAHLRKCLRISPEPPGRRLASVLFSSEKLCQPSAEALRLSRCRPIRAAPVLGSQFRADGHGPRPGISVGIRKRYFRIQVAEVAAPSTVRSFAAPRCEDGRRESGSHSVQSLDPKLSTTSVSPIPVPNRISRHPTRIRGRLQLAAVQKNLAIGQIRIEDKNETRSLNNLHHLRASAVRVRAVHGT